MVKAEVRNLSYRIDEKEILNNISLSVKKGSFVGIIGPNGSGKSTLLKNIYRVLKPTTGDIYIDDKNLLKMKNKECARNIAVLAQESKTNFEFTVNQIVKMGRYPYKSLLESYSKEDDEIVKEMIKKVGLQGYENRSYQELSGGEKQRAHIARALVQNTDFLILDEPTNHLDIGYQIQLMDFIKSLGVTTIAAIHDMNIASMYCDYIYVIKEGKIVCHGKVEEILTDKIIKDVFGVNAYIFKNPISGKLQVSYMHTHNHVQGIGTDHVHEDGFTGTHRH